MTEQSFLWRAGLLGLAMVCLAGGVAAGDTEQSAPAGTYTGTWEVVNFDVSPPLREITPLAVPEGRVGRMMVDPEDDLAGPLGPQDLDPIVQELLGSPDMPAPIVSFDGPSNVSGVSPPDPVGDVGPNHYVAMSNLAFQVFDKTGASLYGPAANNTLWSGFGGACQTSNDGDPIVIYDQLDDRWILTQFTAGGPTYYNCVAISTTPDPTGQYYRYAFSTGANFPDYPKYGMWSDALYISTREFSGSSQVGIGAYAVNRAQLVAGNPNPQVVSFLATAASAGGAYNIGNGLLPSDLDGDTLPPAGSPNFFMGSMDNGSTTGAPQDALTLWKFTVDFATPANSSFVLTNTIPIAAYDTIPAFCSGRACVPQPGTTNKIDLLSYRQRPLHRLAYRNFGTHESLVTNQSVEASATMSGIRWWEVRSPNSSAVLYQEGTYAPGLTDGVHRWMGSIAMDQSGNMALGFSASAGTVTYPSSWYTGRLASDPLGTMPQGEASIIDGTGSQTSSDRWGDYTSMNLDPVDDCTFWYVNQWLPASGGNWRLRIGAFKYDTCGCQITIVPPVASAGVAGANLIVVSFDDSATPEITEYRVYRLVHRRRTLRAGGHRAGLEPRRRRRSGLRLLGLRRQRRDRVLLRRPLLGRGRLPVGPLQRGERGRHRRLHPSATLRRPRVGGQPRPQPVHPRPRLVGGHQPVRGQPHLHHLPVHHPGLRPWSGEPAGERGRGHRLHRRRQPLVGRAPLLRGAGGRLGQRVRGAEHRGALGRAHRALQHRHLGRRRGRHRRGEPGPGGAVVGRHDRRQHRPQGLPHRHLRQQPVLRAGDPAPAPGRRRDPHLLVALRPREQLGQG